MTGFFNDFSRRICEEKDLVDVAPHGVATQSSTSNWSREDDAQRAVSRIGHTDFAFHTDHEKQAWWRLDFERVYYPEILCIENREKDAFWECASKIRIKVSSDGATWTTLHEGMLFFGSLANGVPLILPLAERVAVRHILIENPQPGYFHLKSVRLLARKSTSYSQAVPVFMADRKDGFGERLKSIVNSIALSNHYKGDFRFSWKLLSNSISATHAIARPEQTFSKEFLTKHLSGMTPNTDLKEFLRSPKPAHGVERSAPLVVSVPQTSLYKVNRMFEKKISKDMLTSAFWKIGFSTALTQAITLAQNVDIHDEAIGLHLRAGDIVFGRFRFNARYLNKVVPYPIAMAFIEKQKELGKTVVLFGQDEELCQNLAQKYGIVFAGDYHRKNNFDALQAAMFDILLMSRCQTVVAGNSGFSHIAQVIGQFDLLDPGEIFSAQDSMNIILKTLSAKENAVEVKEYQKSFACSYAFNALSGVVSVDDGISLMQEACKIDPENSFYALLLAIACFRSGDHMACQQILEAAVEKTYPQPSHGALENVVSTKHPDGSFELDKHAACLCEMSDQGIIPALGILALFFKAKGDDTQVRTYRDAFLKSCPNGHLPRFSKKMALIS